MQTPLSLSLKAYLKVNAMYDLRFKDSSMVSNNDPTNNALLLISTVQNSPRENPAIKYTITVNIVHSAIENSSCTTDIERTYGSEE